MPDVRFGIDASGARDGAEEFARYTRQLVAAARQAQAEIDRIQSGGAASPQAVRAAQQQAEAINRQTEATQKLTQAQTDNFATADRVLQVKKQELSFKASLIKGLRDEDAATRRATQATLTALSTLGGANRALSQRIVFEDRLRKGIEAGIITEKDAIEVRKHAEVQFSTAAVKARDLRTNIAGLNQSVQLIASTMGRFNPLLGIFAQSALRAGNAVSKLGGGFVLLGPILGILTAAAAGMTALAVAGDRTGKIPSTFREIVSGAGELTKRLSDSIGASRILLGILEKVRDALPTPQSRVQAARARLEELREGLPEESITELGVTDLKARERQLRAIAEAEKELSEAISAARAAESVEVNKLIRSIDQETAARVELVKNVQQLQIALKRGLISEQEYTRLLGIMNEKERERRESLLKKNDALRESAERTEAYQKALSQLRLEEERTIKTEEKRLEDLRFENDQLEKLIDAYQRGEEAVREFRIEDARLREQRRQSGGVLDAQTSDELVSEAERSARLKGQLDDQQKLANETSKVWDNAINNVQRGFGDLFTNILLQGKDAFDDLGGLLKQMFSRVIGEIVNAELFGPLFDSLRGAAGQQVSQSGGAPSSALGIFDFARTIGDSVAKAVGLITPSVTTNTSVVVAPGGARVSSFSVASPPQGSGFGAGVGRLLGSSSGTGSGSGGSLSAAFGGALTGAGIGLGISSIFGANQGGQIGGIAGGAIGGIALGGAAGGLIGGAGGVALGAGIYGLVNDTPTPGKSALQIAGGSLMLIGAVVPVIGWIIAIIGAILALISLFIKGPSTSIGIGTAQTVEALQARGLEGGFDYLTKETPFGIIGALGSQTSSNLRSAIEGALNTIRSVDNAIARVLPRSDIELIRSRGLPDIGVSNPNRFSQKLVGQRLGTILDTLGVPQETISGLSSLTFDDTEKQIEEVTNLLATRKGIIDILEDLRGTAIVATETAKALEEVSRGLDDIAVAAPGLGIAIDDLDQLRIVAAQKITDAFNKSISDSIVTLTDPSSLAASQLAEQQMKRLAEAVDAGADLVEVERLTGLERVNLLKQINEPLQGLIDTLKFSPSGSSPLAALSAAETRFFDVAAGQGTGDFSRQDLAAAAQTFLSLGEQFLGGPTFASARENVLSVLESFLLDTLPGAGDDTVGELQQLNLETVRGNSINAQFLGQIVDELSSLRSENSELRAQLDRLLAK